MVTDIFKFTIFLMEDWCMFIKIPQKFDPNVHLAIDQLVIIW